jgi:hypothetical protein
MYYTGLDPTTMRGGDPSTMQKVYVPRDPHEKAMQRALIQYRDPRNYALVKEALLREGREDLIGFGDKFLIPPREPKAAPAGRKAKHAAGRSDSQGAGKTDRRSTGKAAGRGDSRGVGKADGRSAGHTREKARKESRAGQRGTKRGRS